MAVEQQDANVRRKPRAKDEVAARADAALRKQGSVLREGVRALNPGFFMLQSMRENRVAKAKAAKRAKLKGN